VPADATDLEARCLRLQAGAQRVATNLEIFGLDAGVPVCRAEILSLPVKDLHQPRRYPQRVARNVPVVDAFSDGLAERRTSLLTSLARSSASWGGCARAIR
jgi:hypothetical protein